MSMPPTASEHADIIWFVLITAIQLLGGGLVAVLVWSARSSLNDIKRKGEKLEANQESLLTKLDTAVMRVHRRVDCIEREVFFIKGAWSAVHGPTDSPLREERNGEE